MNKIRIVSLRNGSHALAGIHLLLELPHISNRTDRADSHGSGSLCFVSGDLALIHRILATTRDQHTSKFRTDCQQAEFLCALAQNVADNG